MTTAIHEMKKCKKNLVVSNIICIFVLEKGNNTDNENKVYHRHQGKGSIC